MCYRKIVNQVKHIGCSVSVATIHRIQHGKGMIGGNIHKTGIFPKRSKITNVDIIQKIHNMMKLVKPQREVVSKCGVS